MTAKRLRFGNQLWSTPRLISKHLQDRFDHWLDCRFHDDAQRKIDVDLRLDVLIELGGYTSGSRLGVMVHRPAPIQLSYLGFRTYLSELRGWMDR